MKFSKKLLKGHQEHRENAILSNRIINCYYYYILPLLSSEYIKVVNQTLYDEIVAYFFPKELRNPKIEMEIETKIEMDFYLCRFTYLTKRAASVLRLVNIMVNVVLIYFSTTVSRQWKNM